MSEVYWQFLNYCQTFIGGSLLYAIDPQKKIFRLIEIYQPNAKVIPLSSIFPTVSKSDVGYCKNYYLKLQEESRTFENFTNSSKGFQNDVFNLAMGFQLSHLWSKLDISRYQYFNFSCDGQLHHHRSHLEFFVVLSCKTQFPKYENVRNFFLAT